MIVKVADLLEKLKEKEKEMLKKIWNYRTCSYYRIYV